MALMVEFALISFGPRQVDYDNSSPILSQLATGGAFKRNVRGIA